MALPIDNSPISAFIDNRIICGDLSEAGDRSSNISKIFAKTAGVAISGFGRVPFVPVTLQLEGLGPYRYLLALCNSTGFMFVGSWAILNIIDEISQPLTIEEELLLKNQLGTLSKTVSIASALFLSTTSKGVTAYIAYSYNGNNILMPMAVMLSDTSFPFYSSLLSTRKILEKHSFSEIEKKINLMRSEVINLIERNRALFVASDRNEKTEYLSLLSRIKQKKSKEGRLKDFLPIILKKNPEIEQEKIEKYGKAIFGAKGGLLTLNHMLFLGIVSYVGGELITSSPVGGIIAASLTIGSNVYLEGTSLIKTGKRAFEELYNLFTCRQKPTLSKQLSPKLTFVLQSLGLLISLNAWGPNVQIADDFIEQNGFKVYMEITTTIAIILLVSTATLDIIDGIVEMKIIKKGSEEEKEILKIDRKLKRLTKLIDKSPLIEFVKFAKIIPKEALIEIQNRCNVTQNELNRYIHDFYDSLDRKKLAIQEETLPLLPR